MNLTGLQRSFAGRLLTKVSEDNALSWAIIIAWNTLTTLFPLVLVAAAALGFMLGSVGVNSEAIYATILHVLPSDANARADAINALNTVQQRSGIFLAVGFGGLIWSATGLFRSMEQAFTVIYHTKQRTFFRGVLMSLVMMLIFIALVGVIVVSSTYLEFLSGLRFLPSTLRTNGIAALVVQFLIGAGSGFALFLAIYRVVPTRKLSFAKVWPGALLAGILFEGLSLLFPVYLRFTGGGIAYGKTFGLIFLLMAFFYFLGIVTMLGAEVNSLLHPVPGDQPEGPESLRTPIQVEPKKAAKTAAKKAAAPGAKPRSRSRRLVGLVAIVVLALTGVLRGRGRRRPA